MNVPRQAIVLAAGHGTRLRPWTEHRPKGLFPFLNVPILEHAVSMLASQGVERIAVNAHHLADQVVDHFAARLHDPLNHDDVDVHVEVERDLLGTGGALKNLTGWIEDGPCFLLCGDVVAPFDLAALARRHAAAGAAASMAVVTAGDVQRYGAIEVDDHGDIVDIAGLVAPRDETCDGPRNDTRAPAPRRSPAVVGVNGSLHLFEHDFVAALPDGPCCLIRDGYLPLLASGQRAAAWVHTGPWGELGTPETLLEAQARALTGRLPVDRRLLTRGGRRLGEALVHPTARVDRDATLRGACVVGAGAVIGRGANLDACLVLPDARIDPGVTRRGAILGGPVAHNLDDSPAAGAVTQADVATDPDGAPETERAPETGDAARGGGSHRPGRP